LADDLTTFVGDGAALWASSYISSRSPGPAAFSRQSWPAMFV
jgi:hypothetical protein